MSVICKIDNSEWDTLEDMHDFLRRRMKRSDYYELYYPKKCRQTGEKISFKDYKQYFAQDFKDKIAMKQWFKANPVEAKEWAIEWLRKRKEEKGLVYAPSQVELRSLQCPSMPYYESIGGYYAITQALGFKERYSIQVPKMVALPDNACVVVDTREQAPLKLPVLTISAKVEEGDYALAPPHDKGIYIERKGLGDFVGTLNCRKVTRKKKGDDSSFERFDRELARAVEKGSYIVMLVEASINDALGFEYLPQMKWTKVSASHVFKNLRDLLVKYPLNFQVVFASGRKDAATKMMNLFKMGVQVKTMDLQYAVEKGLL